MDDPIPQLAARKGKARHQKIEEAASEQDQRGGIGHHRRADELKVEGRYDSPILKFGLRIVFEWLGR